MSGSKCSGTATWTSAKTFQATFTVNGIKKFYTGTAAATLPKWEVNQATAVYYKDVDDEFFGTQQFTGSIGDKAMKLKIGGIEVTGDLNAPIKDGHTYVGSGSWDSNFHEGTRTLASPLRAMTNLRCLQSDHSNELLLRKNGRRIVGVGSDCVTWRLGK